MLIISTTAAGGRFSYKLKERVLLCRELLKLCDILIIDVSSRKNSVRRVIENNAVGLLSFISFDMLIKPTVPDTVLDLNDSREIGEFIYSLGKSDTKSQLLVIESFKSYIKERERHYAKKYAEGSRLAMMFGFFGGVIIALTVI